MKAKKLLAIFVTTFFYSEEIYAKSSEYPYVSGQVLTEFKADRVTSTKKDGVPQNNAYINIEPDIYLNLNENWSVRSGLRIWPALNQNRDPNHPERSRSLLSDNRGFNQDDTSMIVEELKAHFQNDDLKFFAGKFNPTFATLYRKTKRIGVFLTDWTEDYELREKIGVGGAALLEDSEITVNSFFNDTTGLSNSALRRRGKEDTDDGIAGNTSTLSSYTITMEGRKLLGVENLYYNVGYRSLGVKDNGFNKREKGYTGHLEYLHKVGYDTSIIPLIEVVKINNFTGLAGRDAKYVTMGVIAKYSGWTGSATQIFRNISKDYSGLKTHDRQLQLSVGYKFKNNISVDFSRANIKEDSYKGTLMGVMASYLYQF